MNATIPTETVRAASEPVANRRGDTRIPCALEVRCQSADGAEWPALAVNVSGHGARLVSFLDAEPLPLVSVRFKSRKGTLVELPAILVHAQGCRNLWMMGCRFERPLTDEELHVLVPHATRNKSPR